VYGGARSIKTEADVPLNCKDVRDSDKAYGSSGCMNFKRQCQVVCV